VRKRGFETCAECDEVFNCAILLRRKVAQWVPAPKNLRQIQEAGLEHWLREQRERQGLVEELLRSYNEGRSMSLYCNACARMPTDLIHQAVKEVRKRIMSENIDDSDMRSKAKILKSIIKDTAVKFNINMS